MNTKFKPPSRRLMRMVKVMMVCTVLLLPGLAMAQTVTYQTPIVPATLDNSFGSAGTGIVLEDYGAVDSYFNFEIQPDHKIVAVGMNYDLWGGIKAVAARYNTDGTLDTTFGPSESSETGSTGKFACDLGGQGTTAHAVAIQPDGEIIVGMYFIHEVYEFDPETGYDVYKGNFPYLALGRLRSDGIPEPPCPSNLACFGTELYTCGDINIGVAKLTPGKISLSSPMEVSTMKIGIAIQSNGKIVVGGLGGVARFNANGSLDSSFNPVIEVTGFTDISFSNVKIDSNGKIVASGAACKYVANPDPNGSPETLTYCDALIARLLPNGVLDTFGNAGIRTEHYGDATYVTGLALVPVDAGYDPGGIVAVGMIGSAYSPLPTGGFIIHYNNSGNEVWRIENSLTIPFALGDVTLDPYEKILAAGVTQGATGIDLLVLRLNSNGSDDPTFNQEQSYYVITDLGGSEFQFGSKIAVQSWDEKILVAGIGGDSAAALLRYLGDQWGLDRDGDGIPDLADNCPVNMNRHQERTNTNTGSIVQGDKCIYGTFNPSFESFKIPDNDETLRRTDGSDPLFFANTPAQRSAVHGDGCLSFTSGQAYNLIYSDLYLYPDDGSKILKFCPMSINVGPGEIEHQQSSVYQSTWQSLVEADSYYPTGTDPCECDSPPCPVCFGDYRNHFASGANFISFGTEIMNLSSVSGDVKAKWALTWPSGFSVDTSQLSNGKGKITIKDTNGVPVYRISAVGCGALGKTSLLADDWPAGALPGDIIEPTTNDPNPSFFGFTRMIEEMGPIPPTPHALPIGAEYPIPNRYDGVQPTVGPGSLNPVPGTSYDEEVVGIRHHFGTTSANIKLRQEGHENQSDSALGTWSWDGSILTATCSYNDFVDKNKGISNRMLIGMRVSNITRYSQVFAGYGGGLHSYGRHAVVFDEELDDVNPYNYNVSFTFKNDLAPHNYFNGVETDYLMLPNDGKTCAFNKCTQGHTGLGFAGSRVKIAGMTVDFSDGGGGGVGVGSGDRVAEGDPCQLSTSPDRVNWTTNTGRCYVDVARGINYHKRGVLNVSGNMTVNGAMSGLDCGEADCTIGNKLTATLGHDPNITDKNLMRARIGVGCAASKGVQFGWNVVANEVVSNVPTSLGSCSLEDVGRGLCFPTALSDPGETGICNLEAKIVELHGQSDPLLPAGMGLGCGQMFGKCNISLGSWDCISTNPTTLGPSIPSVIDGFEYGTAVSGGVNVNPYTGVPLRHDDTNAIPPLKACIRNVSITNSEEAVFVGWNSDAHMDGITMNYCQYECLKVGIPSANVATPANTKKVTPPTYPGCPPDPLYPDTCAYRTAKYISPKIGIGQEDHLEALRAGITAPVYLTISNSNIYNKGKEPVLPSILPCDPNFKYCVNRCSTDLKYLGLGACNLKSAAIIWAGPDNIYDKYPGFTKPLLTVNLVGDNFAMSSSPLVIHNVDSADLDPTGMINVVDCCWFNEDTHECETSLAIATAVPDNNPSFPAFADSVASQLSTTTTCGGSIPEGSVCPEGCYLYQDVCSRCSPDIVDDHNPCTTDICDSVTGKITHLQTAQCCKSCVDGIIWGKAGSLTAASNQCGQIVSSTTPGKDMRNACAAKGQSLSSISKYLAEAKKQCLTNFVTEMNMRNWDICNVKK